MKDNHFNQESIFRFHTLIIALIATLPVLAGPPFLTDDPEPVDYRHGEVYCASQLSEANGDLSGTAPQFEVNYGLLPEVQVHAIVRLTVNSAIDPSPAYGPGDIELGVKYRLIKESASMPQAGIFPLVELPVGDSSRGLGDGALQLFLPLWLQKSFGPWTTYGGGGYQVIVGTPSENFWWFGWEGQRDLSTILTLGSELFGVTNQPGMRGTEVGFNAGAIINLSANHHILASAGRDIAGLNKFTSYIAYQLTVGPGDKK
jgi:hypothetical protein